jgi:hypothetical protein
MQGFAPGDPETATLPHGEVLNAIVLANYRAVGKDDLTLPGRQVGIQKSPHRTMVVGQTEVHAFRFLGGTQTKGCRFGAGFGLTHLPEGKNQAGQNLLGQVVKEITLVLVTVQTPPKLMTFATLLCMAQAGVMARGQSWQAAFTLGPFQHRAKLHLPIAARTGQGRHTSLIALHQEFDNLSSEGVAGIHHMVDDTQLVTDASCIYQTLGAAGSFATH